MTVRILVCGLPGSGKTTLAQQIVGDLSDAGKIVTWLNADVVREEFNDWDFSIEGRIRQSWRMRELADVSMAEYAVVDFVAPLPEMRGNFAADWLVWVDTIQRGRYDDTNTMFIAPEVYDFRVTEMDAIKWSCAIVMRILGE